MKEHSLENENKFKNPCNVSAEQVFISNITFPGLSPALVGPG